MGLLDAPALIRSKVGAVVTHELANNQRNVNVCVTSDSTAVDQVEQAAGTDRRWVYLLAQLIGLDFPAYTVQHRQWNATNLNYDAATVIQTGTGTGNAGGPFVLTFWGATKSGATAGYWVGEMALLAPVFSGQGQPAYMDLILIADGHNEVGKGANVRATLFPLVRAIGQLQPGAPIAWVTQNPQNGAGSGSSAAEQTNQLLRMEEVRALARSEGHGLVDVQPFFLADPSYAADLLLADGVHPNATGSALWASAAKQHFPAARDTSGMVTTGPIPKAHRIWIPATAFASALGAPVLAALVNNAPAWSLPNGADTIVATTIDWPGGWRTTNAWIVWGQVTGQVNNWRGRVGSRNVGGSFEPASGSGQSIIAPSAGSLVTIAGRSASNTEGTTQMFSGIDSTTGWTGRPMMFQVERLGTDGADTLTVPVYLQGMWLERAS